MKFVWANCSVCLSVYIVLFAEIGFGHIYMCVYIYVCMYVRTYICMHMCMYSDVYVSLYVMYYETMDACLEKMCFNLLTSTSVSQNFINFTAERFIQQKNAWWAAWNLGYITLVGTIVFDIFMQFWALKRYNFLREYIISDTVLRL